jgi:glycosyltransferase involved in cell wall biosynthesis
VRITIVQGPFLPVPPLQGGAVEKVWFALGREFARLGHQVTHLSRTYARLPKVEDIDGVRHLRVGGFDTPPAWRPFGGRDLLWPVRPCLDLVYAMRVRSALPDADIIVTNSFWLPVLLPKRGLKGALYVHIARYPRAQTRWYSHAARLQPVGSALRAALERLVPEANDRIRYLPNPLPTEMLLRSEAEFEALFEQRQKLIVYSGRLHPHKGLDILIDAFASFSKTTAGSGWRLRFVGPHESSLGGGGERYLAAMKSRLASLNCSAEWTGMVADPSELRTHLEAAGIYVYPSIDFLGEASPIAPLEAMACGCPTVVSNLACFQDYLVSGKTGWTFPVGGTADANELAVVLGKVALDHGLARELALSGWERAKSFSLESVATRYLQDFTEVSGVGLAH